MSDEKPRDLRVENKRLQAAQAIQSITSPRLLLYMSGCFGGDGEADPIYRRGRVEKELGPKAAKAWRKMKKAHQAFLIAVKEGRDDDAE